MSKVLLNLEDLKKVNGGVFYDFVGGTRASGIVLSRGNDSVLINDIGYNLLNSIADELNIREENREAFIVEFFIGTLRNPNSVVKFYGEYLDINEYRNIQKPYRLRFINRNLGG